MKPKKSKLVRLNEVKGRLVLPGKSESITSQALLSNYLPALGIVQLNSDGSPKTRKNAESWITEDQADQIEAEFKRKHWKKFKQS